MRKLTFFFITIFTLISLLIGGSSLAQNSCPSAAQLDVEKSSVYCWLAIKQPESFKYLKTQLQTAVNDVWDWKLRESSSLSTNVRLQPLEKVSSQDLPSELNQNETYYRGVTWVSDRWLETVKKGLNQSTQENSKVKGVLPSGLTYYTWITPVSQTQSFCQTCQGSLINPQMPPLINKRLRLTQYLGLRLTSNKTNFVTLIAKESDLERPCLDQETNDDQCNTPMSSQEIDQFIQDNEDLVSKRYPWTALGYTYDWGKKDHVGASEYVIKPNAEVYIESVNSTCQFCGCE